VTGLLAASLLEDLFVPQVSLLEKALRALLVFAFLVAALRLGGKRELGQINVLDLAVLLLASERAAERDDRRRQLPRRRRRRGRHAVSRELRVGAPRLHQPPRAPDPRGNATVLLEHGHPLERALRSEAITEDQLRAAALERGFDRLADVDLIVLEPNGHLAVMGHESASAWRARQAD